MKMISSLMPYFFHIQISQWKVSHAHMSASRLPWLHAASVLTSTLSSYMANLTVSFLSHSSQCCQSLHFLSPFPIMDYNYLKMSLFWPLGVSDDCQCFLLDCLATTVTISYNVLIMTQKAKPNFSKYNLIWSL